MAKKGKCVCKSNEVCPACSRGKMPRPAKNRDTERLSAIIRWANDALNDPESGKMLWAADLHSRQSIDAARKSAKAAGRSDRCRFMHPTSDAKCELRHNHEGFHRFKPSQAIDAQMGRKR